MIIRNTSFSLCFHMEVQGYFLTLDLVRRPWYSARSMFCGRWVSPVTCWLWHLSGLRILFGLGRLPSGTNLRISASTFYTDLKKLDNYMKSTIYQLLTQKD